MFADRSICQIGERTTATRILTEIFFPPGSGHLAMHPRLRDKLCNHGGDVRGGQGISSGVALAWWRRFIFMERHGFNALITWYVENDSSK